MRTLQVPNPATYIWFPTHTMYSATYVFIHAVLSGWMSSGKLLIFAKVSIQYGHNYGQEPWIACGNHSLCSTTEILLIYEACSFSPPALTLTQFAVAPANCSLALSPFLSWCSVYHYLYPINSLSLQSNPFHLFESQWCQSQNSPQTTV